jgi:transcription elongation factor Elf1
VTDEDDVDFQERPFDCPYCGRETMVDLPAQMDTMGRATCEHCGKDFIIENDLPQTPQ